MCCCGVFAQRRALISTAVSVGGAPQILAPGRDRRLSKAGGNLLRRREFAWLLGGFALGEAMPVLGLDLLQVTVLGAWALRTLPGANEAARCEFLLPRLASDFHVCSPTGLIGVNWTMPRCFSPTGDLLAAGQKAY